jgi:HEAT repeat protein
MNGYRCLAVCVLALCPALGRGDEPRFLDKPRSRWVSELSDQRPAVRREAAFALGKFGVEAITYVPKLLPLLSDKEASVREAAANAIGDIGPTTWDRVVPALADALQKDRDAKVRRGAAIALGNYGERAMSACPALQQALRDNAPEVRQNAAWAIGQLGHVETAGKPVQNTAFYAGPPADAIDALGQALDDKDGVVRRDVAAALGHLGASARSALPALLQHFKKDSDALVRKTALTALVNVVGPEDKAAARELKEALHDRDPEVVRAAALALGNIGGPDAAAAAPALRDALRDTEVANRRLASAALANIGAGAADVVPDLSAALSDPDATVRANAALALAQIGEKARSAVSALIGVLGPDQPEEVRLYAVEALNYIRDGTEPAIPDLLRILRDDKSWRVRQRAVWALGGFSDIERIGAVPALENTLSETDEKSKLVRYEAAVRLGIHLGPRASEKAIDVLQAYLTDKGIEVYTGSKAQVSSGSAETKGGEARVRETGAGDHRWMPATALARVGSRANRPALIAALEDAAKSPDLKTRERAQQALRNIKD